MVITSPVLKPNSVGKDLALQDMQKAMYAYLRPLWGTDYMCYGRAYRNLKDNQYIPEVYTGKREYKDAFFDDKCPAMSFFGLTGGRTVFSPESENVAAMHLIFAVDLSQIKPLTQGRADEEAHLDVQRFLEGYLTDINLVCITDIDRVYSEYSGWQKQNNMIAADMHPRHVFRYDFNLHYDTNFCEQPLISEPLT